MRSTIILACCAIAASSSALTTGNLVVSIVGDGASVLTSDIDTVAFGQRLREITKTGAVVGSDIALTNLPGSRNICADFFESSESSLQLSGDQRFLMIGGYDIPNRSSALTTPIYNKWNTFRVVSRVGDNGVPVLSLAFPAGLGTGVPGSGDACRQIWSDDGSNFAFTGGDQGLTFGTFTSTATTQPLPNLSGSSVPTSSRSVQRWGDLYYYLGSNAYGTLNGMATWNNNTFTNTLLLQTPTFLNTANVVSVVSGRDIYLVSERTIYIASTTNGGGLMKVQKDINGNWNLAYRIAGTQMNNLAFDGKDIYAVSISNNGTPTGNSAVIKTTDTGTGFTPWQTIYSVNGSTNYRMKGIEFAPRPQLTGSLSLLNTVGSRKNKELKFEFFQGGVLQSTQYGSLEADGSFKIGVNVAGTYQVKVSGAPQLREDFGNVNLAIGVPATITGSLRNGDVDGSGEVDAVDIDVVIANFGAIGLELPSDVDRSTEVDAVDIDVVIASFGGVDQ